MSQGFSHLPCLLSLRCFCSSSLSVLCLTLYWEVSTQTRWWHTGEDWEQGRHAKKIPCRLDWSKAVTVDLEITDKICWLFVLHFFPFLKLEIRISDLRLDDLKTCSTLNWDSGRHLFSGVTFGALTCLVLLCCSLCSWLSSFTVQREDPAMDPTGRRTSLAQGQPPLSKRGSIPLKSEFAGASRHLLMRPGTSDLLLCGKQKLPRFRKDCEAGCLAAQPLHRAACPVQFLKVLEIPLHA